MRANVQDKRHCAMNVNWNIQDRRVYTPPHRRQRAVTKEGWRRRHIMIGSDKKVVTIRRASDVLGVGFDMFLLTSLLHEPPAQTRASARFSRFSMPQGQRKEFLLTIPV